MDTLDIARLVSGGFYFTEFVVYAVATLFIKTESIWTTWATVLHNNLLVTGINMLLNVYLVSGGVPEYVWIAYAVSGVYLMLTCYHVLALAGVLSGYMSLTPISSHDGTTHAMKSLTVLTFVTIVTGFVIAVTTDPIVRWFLFVADFVPFVIVVLLLIFTVNDFNRSRSAGGSTTMKFATYATLAFWLGYPIAMILGPLFTGTISADQQSVGHLVLDIITKHVYAIVAAIYAYTATRDVTAPVSMHRDS